MTADSKDRSINQHLVLAFAPIHKQALGTAVGVTAALVVFVLTMIHVILRPVEAPEISLLGQYFYGYSVSLVGAVIGAFWAFLSGFVMGWFLAFVRNLTMAIWIFSVRVRGTVSQPFLDHI